MRLSTRPASIGDVAPTGRYDSWCKVVGAADRVPKWCCAYFSPMAMDRMVTDGQKGDSRARAELARKREWDQHRPFPSCSMSCEMRTEGGR